MKYLLIVLTGVLLTACGGGSGGASSGANAPDASSDVSQPPTAKPILVSQEHNPTMQDLVIPDGFNYDPVKTGSLDVDISGFSSQRAHLSLYKQYQEESSGHYKADYQSKVVSVPLDSGKAKFDFNMSDSQKSLLVEIWFYDGTDPIRRVISPNDQTFTY